MSNTFLEMMKQQTSKVNKRIVTGKVVGKFIRGKEEFLSLDAGMKSEGIVPYSDFDSESIPAIGTQIEVLLVDEKSIPIVFSYKKAQEEKNSEELKKTIVNGEKISFKIISEIPEGYKVSYKGLTGFLYTKNTYKLGDVEEGYIVKTFSNGSFQVAAEKKKVEKTEIKIGSVINGLVKSIHDFFLFLEIDAVTEGVIHIDHFTHKFIQNNNIKVDSPIQAKVLSVDGSKVILSIQDLQEEKIKANRSQYLQGQVYEAEVIEIKENSGIVVEFEEGITAFGHLSEIFYSPDPFKDPNVNLNSFKIGSKIRCKILQNKDEGIRNNMRITIKGIEENPYEKFCKTHKEGQKISAIVSVRSPQSKEILFNIPVSKDINLTATLKEFDISWDKNESQKKFYSFNNGDKVDLVIKNLDQERCWIQLSLKETEPDKFLDNVKKMVPGNLYDCEFYETIRIKQQDKKFAEVTYIKVKIDELDGVFGMIKAREVDNFKEMKPGQKIKAKFTKVASSGRYVLMSASAAQQEEHKKIMEDMNKGSAGDNLSSLGDLFKID